MNSTKSLHDAKIESMAQELSKNGYKVLVEPSNSDLPFDLDGYCPDLIATKNDQGIIVEVKTNLKHLSVDKFQDIAQRVASHHGWRFILVPVENTNEEILPSFEDDFPSWEELNTQLSNLNTLIQQSLFLPALLFMWSILEATLRKRAIAQNLPIERFSPTNLLNHAFSSGEISLSEFDLFKNIFFLRNKVAHGMVMSIDSINLETLKLANNAVNILVKKWYLEKR